MPTKILAIDDSKTIRLAIKITFAAEDADVTSVGKGTEAVTRAKQMGADVVLLDADLADGDLNGLELCRQLKQDDATAKIPVILLVSNQSPPPADAIDAAGADGTLAKPFDTQELIDLVASVQGKPVKAAAPGDKAFIAPKIATPVATPTAPAVPPVMAATKAATLSPAKPAPGRVGNTGRVGPPAAAPPAVSAAKNARVSAITEVGMPTPIPGNAAASSSSSSLASASGSGLSRPSVGGDIPIVIPIPFAAASAPTAGMLKRLEEAAGDSGLDPKTAAALIALSREVIERVVWEVVPELAESIIKKNAS